MADFPLAPRHGRCERIGLVAALIGDGVYDALSWAALGGTVMLIAPISAKAARRLLTLAVKSASYGNIDSIAGEYAKLVNDETGDIAARLRALFRRDAREDPVRQREIEKLTERFVDQIWEDKDLLRGVLTGGEFKFTLEGIQTRPAQQRRPAGLARRRPCPHCGPHPATRLDELLPWNWTPQIQVAKAA